MPRNYRRRAAPARRGNLLALAGQRMRRSLALSRRPRKGGIRQPVQFFKRLTYTNAALVTSQLSPQFLNLTFTLQDVPNYTEFTALYDQYCIKGVKFTLMPRFNSALPAPDVGTNVSSQPPQTWSVLDYDGGFPTTQTAMLQYQNLKMLPGTKWHSRYVVPAAQVEIFNGISTAYAPKKKLYIDTANPDVKHYGATIMVPEVNTSSSVTWDLKTTYYLAFKNVR